jgi:sugar transferase (PEP-CTERM/EpsH1 system associated)
LLKKYNVYFGAFVDNDSDWEYETKLKTMCAAVFLQRLESKKSTVKSVTGFFTNKALTLPYYSNKLMQKWVDDTVSKYSIRKIVVFSSTMAQYIDGEDKNHITRIIDFVDVDSDKWQQYSKSKIWPMNWLYRREAERLLNYESHIAETCNASIFVSKEEADHFQKLVGDTVKNIDYFYNGVDTDYFSPDQKFLNPFERNVKSIVFTGAMDYWANVDAVNWFTKEIFSKLYMADNTVRFYIVGSNPSSSVKALSNINGVVVTGRVPDVRPYLAHAYFAVAPMRIARGIQNKVLEAMAMGCQVLVTSAGAEGIAAKSGFEWLIADTVPQMLASAEKLLGSKSNADMGEKARRYVITNHNWEANLRRLDRRLHSEETTA